MLPNDDKLNSVSRIKSVQKLGRRFGFGVAKLLLLAAVFVPGSVQALMIVPTWDSSITSDPNAATIESTINTAIQFYETRFADPITVTIKFEEMSTAGLEGHSSWWYYNINYPDFLTALQNDATTTNDSTALAHLPVSANNPVTGTGIIRVKTANLRALGFTGYTSGIAGGFDGIIGLHTSQMNLSRASIDPSKYDLMSVAEHEIDEVLGLASSLDSNAGDPLPEDLFRYTSDGSRTFTTSGDDAYFSIDGVNLLARFNQNSSGDFGDWWTAGAHTPQVQDAFITPGATPNPKVELVALDVIGYNLLPEPQPVIAGISLSGTNLLLKGTNGLASGTYYVLTSTNLTLPLHQWTPVATNMLNVSGNFTITVTNAINPDDANRFYALELQ
jgi:hypothetical protein